MGGREGAGPWGRPSAAAAREGGKVGGAPCEVGEEGVGGEGVEGVEDVRWGSGEGEGE